MVGRASCPGSMVRGCGVQQLLLFPGREKRKEGEKSKSGRLLEGRNGVLPNKRAAMLSRTGHFQSARG